jgi:hypothetical protein
MHSLQSSDDCLSLLCGRAGGNDNPPLISPEELGTDEINTVLLSIDFTLAWIIVELHRRRISIPILMSRG